MTGFVARIYGRVRPILMTADGPMLHVDGNLRPLEYFEDCEVECAPVAVPAADGTFARFETGSEAPFAEVDLRVVAWELAPGSGHARPWLVKADDSGEYIEPPFGSEDVDRRFVRYIWPGGNS